MKILIAVCLLASTLAQVADGSDGVPTNPCAAILCISGTECKVVDGRGICVPVKGPAPCPLVKCLPCIEGLTYKEDKNGCQTCECREMTCDDLECPQGQKCRMRDTGIRCITSPCPSFVPECVPTMPCDSHKCAPGEICVNNIPECYPQSGCPPYASCTALTCRGNKILNKCVNLCQKKPTCEDPNPPEPPCKALCRPMCVCKPGFVNNDEGKCIPQSWCRTCKTKKCLPGEYCEMMYPSCPSPPNPPPPNYCPPVPVCRKCVVPECLKVIRCGYGVAKDSNGCYTCNCNPPPIPTEPCTLSCPKGQICVNNGAREYCVDQCKAFEVLTPCASACAIEPTCAVPNPPSPTICVALCVEWCLCQDGYIRDENNRCVREDECPSGCPANQHPELCTKPDACYVEATCSDPNPKPLALIACPAVCVKRCVCNTGFIRAANGQCVTPDQCPAQ